MPTRSNDSNTQINSKTRRIKRLMEKTLLGSSFKRFTIANHLWIVAFHRVENLDSPDPLTCGIAEFAEYCDFFARTFRVVPLSRQLDLLGHRSVGGTLSITFDDGYRDNFDHAAPILERYGLPATFFVATGFIGTQDVAWWDRSLPHAPEWMDWNQVRALHRRGFEIGCHTVTHADLGQISAECASAEIAEAQHRLQTEIAAKIDLFAYPYGGRKNLSDENQAIVRNSGLRCCLSCHGGTNAIDADPFALRRIPVNSARGETADDLAYHFLWNLAHRNSL